MGRVAQVPVALTELVVLAARIPVAPSGARSGCLVVLAGLLVVAARILAALVESLVLAARTRVALVGLWASAAAGTLSMDAEQLAVAAMAASMGVRALVC